MFAATYIAGDSVYVYIVSQSGTPKVTKYLQFTDPTFYNEVQTPVSHYLSIVRSIGPAITYTLIVGNTFANEFVIYGKTDDKEWAEWVLPDERRITLPLNSTDEDTLPLGLALDFTNTERVPQSPKDSGDFPPSPIVFVLNTDGCILAYHYLYSPLSGERFSCPEMKAAKKFGAEKAELPSPVHEVQSPAIPESKIKNEPSSSSKGDLPVVKLIPPPPAPPTSTSSVQPFSFSFAPSASSKLKEEPVKLGPNVQPSKPGFSFLPKAESSSQRVETPKPEPGQGFPPPPSPLQPFTLNFGKVKTPEKDVAPTSAGNSGSASPLATSSASFESKNFAKLPATSSLGLSAIPAFTLPAQTSAPVSTAASPIPSFASVPFAGPSVVSKPFTPATPPGQVSTFPGSSSSSAFLKTPPPPFIAPTKSFLEFNTSLGPTQPKPITSVASPHPTVKTDAEEIADFAAADVFIITLFI
ncbi:hypothetical protein BC829DRAFT_93681 [Chytridium lagenaria]|nr:hypothetical protein BC829DRAFT_93681 [Chytridium lagenaria]